MSFTWVGAALIRGVLLHAATAMGTNHFLPIYATVAGNDNVIAVLVYVGYNYYGHTTQCGIEIFISQDDPVCFDIFQGSHHYISIHCVHVFRPRFAYNCEKTGFNKG